MSIFPLFAAVLPEETEAELPEDAPEDAETLPADDDADPADDDALPPHPASITAERTPAITVAVNLFFI
jgi:hypothetical protein